MCWGLECHSQGNLEKVWTHRRSKAPLLGMAGEGSWTTMGICTSKLSEGGAPLAQTTGGHAPLVWAEQQGAKCDMGPLA